ncbi:MAG: GNAT family N-acetyltransferase [Rhizobiaceae bacterium]|nr:GNAT family N-acetyltransferase [Rhizobiaceae bacterium]
MIIEFGDGFGLRQATVEDHAAFCTVCLKTGDAGEDATDREDDPNLMGLIYAVPYQVLEPRFAFAIEGPRGVAGYLFGALETETFNARLAREWYPRLQAEVRDPGFEETRWKASDWARAHIHNPDLSIPPALQPFPSHGHIDLLPEARGRGIGRRCMEHLQRELGGSGSTGMFLDVHPRNTNAREFYRRLGFADVDGLATRPTSLFMAKRFGRV